MGGRRLPPQHWEGHPEIELIEDRKPAKMHHDSDEDRLAAAERLGVQNPRTAGAAFAAIARDEAVGDEVRLSAAELLARADPRAAAPACLAIASDPAVGDEVRLSAAELLANVSQEA